jgi:hypothetical protein
VYGLTDSPIGQLAWIVEKFKEWSNRSAEVPEDAVERDTLLTNVMVYWLTATGGSAARMYYEGRKYAERGWFPLRRSEVPTAVANFAGDMAIRRWAEEANTVVRWTEFDPADTSRPWRPPTCWPATSGSSSAPCGEFTRMSRRAADGRGPSS